jgi:LAGLIDADG endonuclease
MLKRDIKNTNYLYFLAGFVEGEGSMSVSVTVHKDFKYGVNIQPIFNVTQQKMD